MHSNKVYIHLIDLDAPEDVLGMCKPLLYQDERERARSFLRKTDADRWTIARAGLKDILARYCEVLPRDIRFRCMHFGKPVLDGAPCRSGVHFNLSHSGSIAAVAGTRLGSVGIDIEYKRSIPDWKEVAARFFSIYENERLLKVDEGQRDDVFLRYWTCKEAVIKATGEGLSAELDSFDISLPPDRPPEVVRYRNDLAETGCWTLRHFETDNFVAAVAINENVPIELAFNGYWSFGAAPTIACDLSLG
jgi:4'-phosphopantetheinyl transferase